MSQELDESPVVLIVDDIESNRTMLRRYLIQKHHCRVLEAEDGEQAVALALKESPVLILMDIGLPKHGGLVVTEQMRKLHQLRNVPIVAVTAYDSPGLRLEAERAGVTDFMTKPLELEKFSDLIERFLHSGGSEK